MMLPQFGYIVAQAGADSHTLPAPQQVPPPATPSNSGSALAPLLHSKPFNFGHGSSSNMSTSDVGYYHNNYTTTATTTSNNSTLPYYSRQPSPPSHNVIQQQQPLLPPPPVVAPQQQQQQQVTPPPPQTSFLYNQHHHIPPKEIMPKGFTPVLETNNKKKKETSSPWYRNTQQNIIPTPNSPYYNDYRMEEEMEDHHSSNNKWHVESKVVTTANNSTTTRQEVKEYNDLMTWMDNEFWEQADEIYQEKLLNLQNELVNIQNGTHSAFREMIADYELKREKSITDAECFMKYQISFIEQYFDQDLNALEDEYENERRHLQDTLITSIEDRRRQIRDEKEENNDNEEGNNTRSKRTLRKRNADATALRAEPLSKRRAVRPSTLHNIHNISPIEDEELEAEFLNMKAEIYK